MKRILTISTLILFFALGFSACGKIEKGTPPAIKKLIREKKHTCSMMVVEYTYYEDFVYLFDGLGCDDGMTYAYNRKGEKLWESGGIALIYTGPNDFYEKAIKERIVWTKK